MSASPIHWRPLATTDLPALERMASIIHPDFFEERAVLAERQKLCPEGAWLLELAGHPAGYILSHPWRFGQVPALNSLLGAIPPDADTYYLHDLALLPEARGIGAARTVLDILSAAARAKGLATMSLVAVNGSQGFWQRHGFAVRQVPHLTTKLASYAATAAFMVRTLG